MGEAGRCAPPKAWGPGHSCAEDLRALGSAEVGRVFPRNWLGLRRRCTPSTQTHIWALRKRPRGGCSGHQKQASVLKPTVLKTR